MTRVFRGRGLHKVDSKGRVSVPAAFRRVLESCDPDWTDGLQPNLVVHYGTARKNFLECYTMEAAAAVDAKIAALPRGSKDRRIMESYFNGMSHPATIDENGRLLLPQWIRDMIGLDGDAFFVANHDTFSIWKPETYEQEFAPHTEAMLEELPDDVDPLTLLEGGGI